MTNKHQVPPESAGGDGFFGVPKQSREPIRDTSPDRLQPDTFQSFFSFSALLPLLPPLIYALVVVVVVVVVVDCLLPVCSVTEGVNQFDRLLLLLMVVAAIITTTSSTYRRRRRRQSVMIMVIAIQDRQTHLHYSEDTIANSNYIIMSPVCSEAMLLSTQLCYIALR